MDLLKGKSIEQVIKEDEEALEQEQKCEHPNPVLISRNGENVLICRDCGLESDGFN